MGLFEVLDTTSAAYIMSECLPEFTHIFKEYVQAHGWPETDLTKSDEFNSKVFLNAFIDFIQEQSKIEHDKIEWAEAELHRQG